jgi:hypothetical protein
VVASTLAGQQAALASPDENYVRVRAARLAMA